MLRVNLHIHSTCSDGAYTPTELVHLLYRNGVSIASLTDHDTAIGVPAFLAGCHKRGIRAVIGTEFSSQFRPSADNPGIELHILGYRFDLESPVIKSLFDEYNADRERRNAEICAKLNDLGCHVTMDEVKARAEQNRVGRGNKSIGRPHIAQVLKDKGYVDSIQKAFVRYLGSNGAAYVPRRSKSSQEIIKIILEAGGLPVWAHPMASLTEAAAAGKLPEPGTVFFTDMLDELCAAGLRGVECWSHHSSSAQIFTCLREAGARGLLTTAGTDFHGLTGHSSKISGYAVPDDILPWARFCGGR